MKFKVVIPARHASSRLPGKPLLDIGGKPMVQHVYERSVESGAEEVVVATDDARIQTAVEAFNGKACMTSENHLSGTDRLAEVVEQRGYADADIVVNVQGDEPLIPPQLIRQVAEILETHASAAVATLCTPITTAAEIFDPHVVKAVMDENGYALYFSRAAIPWDRDAFIVSTDSMPENSLHYRHIGIYAYRAEFLKHYSQLAVSPLETMESLEQLRVLWHGYKIAMAVADTVPGHGVDTESDLEQVRIQMGAH